MSVLAMPRHLRTLALALPLLVLGASPAEGRTPAGDRPWGSGILLPGFGLGLGFNSVHTRLNVGVGASYFVAPGLALGLGLSNTTTFFHRDFRAAYPGIDEQVTTNEFRVMPSIRYVFWRSRRFSPYLQGGAGPVFLNRGGGTVGEWQAGPGAFIGLSRRIFLDLGIGFSARFPRDRCEDAFTYTAGDGSTLLFDACSLRWGPRLGLVVAFGGGRHSRGRRSQRERQPPPPPATQPQRWEAPAPAPEPAPAPYAAPEPAPEPAPAPYAAPQPAPSTEPAPEPSRTEPSSPAPATPGEPEPGEPGVDAASETLPLAPPA